MWCTRAGGRWLWFAALLASLLASEVPLLSQAGPAPRTRRRNYPLGGLGLPMPDLPQVNYRGKLQKLDKKIIVLQLDDGRTFHFQRSGKTKFYKDSKEVKSSELYIGDRVSVDAVEDPQAFLDAVAVTFDNSPPNPQSGTASDAAKTGGEPNAPPSIQYGDNGRPTLRRRTPAPIEPHEPARPAENPATPRSSGIPANPGPAFPSRMDLPGSQDPLIEKARTAVLSSNNLPNFVCQELMTRSTRDSNASSWQPLDTASADVVYGDGKESQGNVRINSQPAGQQQLSGSWPIERLVSALRELFSPAAAAQFQFGGETNLVDLQARVYDFDVKKENSQWLMSMGTQSINAAYRGSVWIDKQSGRVLRLEMQAHDLPAAFPLDRVEATADYSLVHIGQESALVPTHVETMGCQRETHTCSQSVVDFRNYRSK